MRILLGILCMLGLILTLGTAANFAIQTQRDNWSSGATTLASAAGLQTEPSPGVTQDPATLWGGITDLASGGSGDSDIGFFPTPPATQTPADVAANRATPTSSSITTAPLNAGGPRPNSAPSELDAARVPPVFSVIERADLTPPAPTDMDYTPVVANTTTIRLQDGQTYRYATYYGGQTTAEPRPVVVLLHGANRDELSMIDMWDEVADRHNLVLVSIRANGEAWDPNIDESAFFIQTLNRVASEVSVDLSRVLLFGHSSGAIYAQMLANRHDGPWQAVAAHAGTVPEHWLRDRDQGGVPIRHYLGDNDAMFPVNDATVTGNRFSQAGHSSELVVIPGHNHWFYEGGPAIAEDAWVWFADEING